MAVLHVHSVEQSEVSVTQDVQGPVGARGGGVGARRQRQLGAEDAAAGLKVGEGRHAGICYHRVVAPHLPGGRQEPRHKTGPG